ncbi:MAG: hypothetical protein LUE10_05160 [Alistipes sp.]|nr:hypothetical protein [Alistipes sp.]
MSRIYPIFAVLLLLASCLGREGQPAGVDHVAESVEMNAGDSILSEVFSSLNEITENLNIIRIRENLISSAYPAGEVPLEPTAGIKADLEAIDLLLEENRQTIARLRGSAEELRKANYKVTSLESLLTALGDQMAAKDAEIAELKEQLQIMSHEAEVLAGTVEELSTELEELTRIRGELTDSLHTAYYIVGSARELQRKGIISKSGLIGRTKVVRENRELDDFVRTDTRHFEEVIIGRRNVELITNHPDASYVFVMGDKRVCQSLVITHKPRFWGRSKVLVISYK